MGNSRFWWVTFKQKNYGSYQRWENVTETKTPFSSRLPVICSVNDLCIHQSMSDTRSCCKHMSGCGRLCWSVHYLPIRPFTHPFVNPEMYSFIWPSTCNHRDVAVMMRSKWTIRVGSQCWLALSSSRSLPTFVRLAVPAGLPRQSHYTCQWLFIYIYGDIWTWYIDLLGGSFDIIAFYIFYYYIFHHTCPISHVKVQALV